MALQQRETPQAKDSHDRLAVSLSDADDRGRMSMTPCSTMDRSPVDRRQAGAADHDLHQSLQTLALLGWLLARTVEGDRAKRLVARLGNTVAAMSRALDGCAGVALEQSRDARTLLSWRDAAASHIASLTTRQREIMELVLAGHPSKNIAADLGISQRTVESHRAAIMKRTGSKSLPALARLAFAAGPSGPTAALPILSLSIPRGAKPSRAPKTESSTRTTTTQPRALPSPAPP